MRILASSRQRLGVDGESTFPLPTLALPNPARLPPLETLRNFESVRLFQDRAAAGLPAFAVSSVNALAVAQICHRLDGIPLAIELAAARVKVLSPEQIVARLDDRFRLLTGGSRSALPRQQTLRALIDWSYDLLEDGERTLLQRLSVFSGGWTLEAAEAVCADETTLEAWDILDYLSNLIDKSLVVMEDDQSSAPRYRLLQTVHHYASERHRETGDDQTAARHRDWYLDIAEKAEVELQGAGQAEWLNRLEAENDNLRAALTHALKTAPAAGLRASGALWRFWTVRGHFTEGRDWLDRLLRAEAEEATRERAKALRAAGALATNQGDYAAARNLLTLSRSVWRSLGDQPGEAGTLNSLGNVAFLQAEYAAARALYEESLEISRERGDQRGVAVTLISLGNVATQQGEYDRAGMMYGQALVVVRQIGNREWEAATLQNLGDVAFNQGDYRRAETLYDEAVEARRNLGDRRGAAVSLAKVGNVASRLEDYDRARPLLEEALTEIRDLGDRGWEAMILGDLGHLLVTTGNIEEGYKLHCQSLILRRNLEDRLGISDSLRELGIVACLEAKWAHAVRLFAAAEKLREAIGVTLPPSDREEYENRSAAARQALGEALFTATWQEGRAAPPEEVIAAALP
jgi:non-specific serine/threonine protein kinase